MGISRDSRHKRRLTGGRVNIHQKKRKFELGRPAANTKLVQDPKVVKITSVRGRGGNIKRRAIRLDSGSFSMASEGYSTKARIVDVVYNASNNELERTKTLVKNAIVSVDATPFRHYLERKYNIALSKSGEQPTLTKTSLKKAARRGAYEINPQLKSLFETGRLYAAISSRPGQCGRADGYILEGKELEFYVKKITSKK